MSYSLFLLIFVIAPAAALAVALRRQLTRVDLLQLAAVALIAVVYTTPWDNYLVATGVWTYDPRLVLGATIGWVPVEEYAFFILQVFFTGFLLHAVMRVLRQGE